MSIDNMGIGKYDIDPQYQSNKGYLNSSMSNQRYEMKEEPRTMNSQPDQENNEEGRRSMAKRRGFDAVEYGRIRSMMMGNSRHSDR